MIIEAILLIAIITAGFIVYLDKVLYPRYNRLFRDTPKLVVFSKSMLPILVLIFGVRAFTYEAFRIPSASMKPTLVAGDLVIVDKYSLGLRLPLLGYRLTSGQPQRGDVVVFRGEVNGQSAGLIKRVVGLAGDHIKYDKQKLYINGQLATQTAIPTTNQQENDIIQATENLGNMQHDIFMTLNTNEPLYPYNDIIVPENSYYVIGDHRTNSHDSRYWGVVEDQKLIGKARLVLFSIDWPNKAVRWQRIGRIN